MTPMPISLVHEEVHQGTQEERQIDESAQRMGAVLAQQQNTSKK
jgi:hypothetical protein